MNYCNDCGHEITAESSTDRCESLDRLGCYYSGPAICLHCAHWRYRESLLRADFRAAVEQCWTEGAITARGKLVLLRAIGGDA